MGEGQRVAVITLDSGNITRADRFISLLGGLSVVPVLRSSSQSPHRAQGNKRRNGE